MKKMLSLFVLLLINLSVSESASAFQLSLLRPQFSRGDFTLFTIHVMTRSGRSVKTKIGEADYVGTSLTAPCSDMRLLTSGSGKAELAPGLYPFSANNFNDYPGPRLTCFRIDFGIKGRVYSTGNIQLTWNPANHNYTDANPKIIPLEIDW